MKTFTRSFLLAAAAALIPVAPSILAQTLPVTVQMTIQQQDFSTFNNGVYNDKIKSMKLTSYDLLTLLGGVYQTNFPAGAKLILLNYTQFQVQGPDGAILVDDTSPYLTYSDSYGDGDYLYQGKESTINNSQNHSFFYSSKIRFEDPATNGTSFTFSGNLTEKYSKSAINSSGLRTYQDSFALMGYGSGKTGDNFFLLSGRITAPVVKWEE